MAKINGKPMIGHVYERVIQSNLLSMTAVATCDQEIFDYITSIGGTAIITSNTHERASDRCAEALLKLESINHCRFDIVVMIQGDEPMTHPDMITEAVTPMLIKQNIQVVNLLGKIEDMDQFRDPNCIKVVSDLRGDALYFSRVAIPNTNILDHNSIGRQICVIPFRRDFLLMYSELQPTPLEIIESIDMMRILEHGEKIRMIPTKFHTYSVDTPEDLSKVEKIMARESIV